MEEEGGSGVLSVRAAGPGSRCRLNRGEEHRGQAVFFLLGDEGVRQKKVRLLRRLSEHPLARLQRAQERPALPAREERRVEGKGAAFLDRRCARIASRQAGSERKFSGL